MKTETNHQNLYLYLSSRSQGSRCVFMNHGLFERFEFKIIPRSGSVNVTCACVKRKQSYASVLVCVCWCFVIEAFGLGCKCSQSTSQFLGERTRFSVDA